MRLIVAEVLKKLIIKERRQSGKRYRLETVTRIWRMPREIIFNNIEWQWYSLKRNGDKFRRSFFMIEWWRETTGLSYGHAKRKLRDPTGLPYGLVWGNGRTAGISCVRLPTIPPSSSLSARSHLPCKAKEAFLKVICLCQNGSFKIVGTGVPDCPNRMSAGAVPGRNYKLLPALATNSPPDYSLNASRHPPYERS